jgi:apolipoprotein D and lipocalin family protein
VLRSALTLLALAVLGCTDREPDIAQGLSLERFQGRWYEIARIPRDYDRACHDTTAEYRLTGPNALELTHRCRLGSSSGKPSTFRAPATPDDPRISAKLTLDLGLYRGSYWVLAVDEEYRDALIGHPSLTMLWILSRGPTLSTERYHALTELAERQGYGIAALEMTPQSEAE